MIFPASDITNCSVSNSRSAEYITSIHTLTVPIERAAGAQVVDTLCEALRERRQVLKTETRQLRQDWQESESLRARKNPSTQQSAALPLTTPDAN